MGGGLAVAEGSLWWQSKTDNAGVTGYMYKRHARGDENDFADHTSVITLKFGPQWEDGAEPGQLKYIPRVRVYNVNRSLFQTPYTLTIKTELDYNLGITDTVISYPFTAGTSSGGWGLFAWGTGGWGTPVVVFPRPYKLKLSKFHALRFIFSHGVLSQRAIISGWEYELIFPYRAELVT
jgi:hypothetical protein